MISLHNILTVARIEAKTLWRSWFFRIFSIIAVVFIGFFDFAALSPVTHSPWEMRGIPSSIPYMNLLLLNMVQAVIAVFLASDFLKRDRKLDTTEVVYMRSMTNFDYVAGKTIGILLMFLLLNLAVLLLAAVGTVVIAGLPLMWLPYLAYPLLISLPTLVFILGLAFLMMILIRNQAVTFVVLLGYIGVSLFYLGPKVDPGFDYLAFTMPMFWSGIAGLADPWLVLVHRGIYLFIGIGCIAATMAMIRRLPQSRAMTGAARSLAIVSLAAAAVLVAIYARSGAEGRELRSRMREAAARAAGSPLPRVVRCDIDLAHRGRVLDGSADIAVVNDAGTEIGEYILRLNPGLAAISIESAGRALPFSREAHLLRVRPARPLEPGGTDSLRIRWSGTIDEEAMYPDVDEETRRRPRRVIITNIGSRYAYVEPSFVLLTPEAMWYPAAGPGFVPADPLAWRRSFARYSLVVRTRPGLTAISQGAADSIGAGVFSFRPEDPLPQLSLAVGRYDRISTTVDSVEYAVCHQGAGYYYAEHFTEIGDTLPSLIGDLRRSFESRLGLEYPFPRFSLVETPIHFTVHDRVWSVAQATVQPEIVLFPEKGVGLRGADFQRMSRRMERRTDRSNQDVSAAESQAGIFTRFVNFTITGGFSRPRWHSDDPFERDPSYNVFPNMVEFRTAVGSDGMPYLDVALQAWYLSRIEESPGGFMRFVFGLTPEERVNLRLAERSLREILADPEARGLAHYALRSKGDYLMRMIESSIGRERLDEIVSGLFERYRFSTIPPGALVEALREEDGPDLEALAAGWFDSTEMPGYRFSRPELYKVLDGERERWQVRLDVTNPEPVDGLLRVSMQQRDINMGRGRGFGPVRTVTATMTLGGSFERYVRIGAGETLELGFVLDFQPSSIEINTMIARNLPAVVETEFEGEADLRRRAEPFDGERALDRPLETAGPGEIIVDNEDPGFSFAGGGAKSLLRRLLPRGPRSGDEKYVGMRLWEETTQWLPTVNDDFWGGYVRSARYTTGGKGNRTATFAAAIPGSGHYDVYYHVSKIEMPWRRRHEDTDHGTLQLLVRHDDGVDEVDIDLNAAEEGWTFIGSYYLSAGEATLQVTNRSEARAVIADAARWVRK